MKLWHICSEEKYQKILTTGICRADGRYIWRDFKPAYGYMINEMQNRLPNKKQPSITYPVWVWYKWFGKFRPDLRQRGHLEKGTRGVLLELDIPKERVLLSDFDLWHFVLNNSHLSLSEQEFDASTNLSQTEIEKSWDNVFDLEFKRDANWFGSETPDSIQGTLWSFSKHEIKSVKRFTAR